MIRIKNYYTEQIRVFNECHSNLLKAVTEQDIHKLRTTLKRLKTFNILLDGLLFRQKDFPIEFTNLFKLSGEIRDIQIQQKILEEYDDSYKSYLLFVYEDRLKKFKIKESFENEIQYLTDKLNRVDNYHIDEQIIINIQTRIEMGYDDIRIMVDNISPETLHEIRIKLKRIYYTLLMLSEMNDAEKLNNIQDTIGLWHDYDVTIENIRRFDNNLEIIKSLSTKRDSLYNESLDLLKSF
jgi:CHAD domain-containing protein